MPPVVISGTFMGNGYYVDYGAGLIPQVLITGSMGGGSIARTAPRSSTVTIPQ